MRCNSTLLKKIAVRKIERNKNLKIEKYRKIYVSPNGFLSPTREAFVQRLIYPFTLLYSYTNVRKNRDSKMGYSKYQKRSAPISRSSESVSLTIERGDSVISLGVEAGYRYPAAGPNTDTRFVARSSGK